MRKFTTLIIIAALIVASFIIYGLFNTSVKKSKFKMGTIVEITLNGPSWVDYDVVFDKAFLAIDDISKLSDRYDKNSQLSLVNRQAHKTPVKIDQELYDLIEVSVKISESSDGAFDITIAPLMELWGFYRENNKYPSDEEVKHALAAVNYKNIVLDPGQQAIYLKNKDTKIDLSAIAKGYAVDKAVSAIKASGINSAIVNAGGDIYCLGKKNIFKSWIVGIRDPLDKKRIIDIIELRNEAVATSGGYEQFFIHEGVKYSHLINPKTGYPVEASRNATIVVSNCMLADAFATTLCILDKDKAEAIKEKYNIKLYIF